MHKILIVEEQSIIMKTIEAILAKEHYDITAVKDANEARELLDKQGYSLIILDIIPYVNGIELISKIKSDITHQAHDTPILILSALQTEDAIIEGFNAGASDYLKKPFIPGELLSRVKRLLTVKA